MHRARRHQSALGLAPGGDALHSRFTEDYCWSDHLRFILFWLEVYEQAVCCRGLVLLVLPSVIEKLISGETGYFCFQSNYFMVLIPLYLMLGSHDHHLFLLVCQGPSLVRRH